MPLDGCGCLPTSRIAREPFGLLTHARPHKQIEHVAVVGDVVVVACPERWMGGWADGQTDKTTPKEEVRRGSNESIYLRDYGTAFSGSMYVQYLHTYIRCFIHTYVLYCMLAIAMQHYEL